ncbi:Fur family transcriptional regulator [Halomonas dongshanensis]|uniref:Transcriptional repressor n=1 Tax=Halomonas dongshanensis TaxID=2890835 RepID=A0ABT2EAA6_9GAMM|nr:Fur family transcriptional regulator [Halomonas dongshanensis]MCS2608507.1 transcriptional repressor [Halomonas dongshanensis]
MPLTANQKAVYTALRRAQSPLSAYTLLARLREQGFNAPTQVYRALDRLLEQGIVHRLESMNAYVSCRHSDGCHHAARAFAICDNCGHVDEFSDDELAHCLGRWTSGNGFSLSHTTVELHGLCGICASSRAQDS